jgi:hypothetical protein
MREQQVRLHHVRVALLVRVRGVSIRMGSSTAPDTRPTGPVCMKTRVIPSLLLRARNKVGDASIRQTHGSLEV